MSGNHGDSLDGIALLAPLSADARTVLARNCTWHRYQTGEQIIDRMDEDRDVHFVVSGTITIVNFSVSGREISYDDVDAGGFFGELSAIDGSVRSASAVAKTTARTAALPAAQFVDMVQANSAVGMALLLRMVRIIRTSTDRIMDLSTLAANNRVQAEVLRIARITEPDAKTAKIYPVPIHADVAARVSTTRETVARVFGDLTRRGLLKKSGHSLIITDVDHLKDMVEEVRGDI